MKTRNYFMLLVIFNLSMIQLIKSQNQIWSLPPFYLINDGINQFYDPLPVPTDGLYPGSGIANDPYDPYDGYDWQKSNFVHNAMQDENGDLLFFIVDGIVYNKDGFLLMNYLILEIV